MRKPVAALATGLFAASLALTACGAPGGGVSESAADKDVAPDNRQMAPSAGPAQGVGSEGGDPTVGAGSRKPAKLAPSHVIRTARLTVRVKDVPAALADARTAAEGAGGYVGDETTDRDPEGHERSRVVLRVPQDAYERVLDDLAGAGKLVERKVNAQDVTDQVVDVESRIKSQRASVARVRKLMDQAQQLSDVVTLEGELSTREAELESLEAQQASLKDRTSMATITLMLSETAVASQKDDDETSFTDALSGGWEAFLAALRWIAVAVGAVLPFAVALGLIALVWRTVRGRLNKRPKKTT